MDKRVEKIFFDILYNIRGIETVNINSDINVNVKEWQINDYCANIETLVNNFIDEEENIKITSMFSDHIKFHEDEVLKIDNIYQFITRFSFIKGFFEIPTNKIEYYFKKVKELAKEIKEKRVQQEYEKD